MKAARSLLAKLQTKNPTLVQSMEKLCNAYIDVACYDVSAYKTIRDAIKFPPSCPLLKFDGKVAIPTVDLDVDRTCQYEHILCLCQFEPFFQLAGGVNLPKIVTCIGSDGKRRKQLIKVCVVVCVWLLLCVCCVCVCVWLVGWCVCVCDILVVVDVPFCEMG